MGDKSRYFKVIKMKEEILKIRKRCLAEKRYVELLDLISGFYRLFYYGGIKYKENEIYCSRSFSSWKYFYIVSNIDSVEHWALGEIEYSGAFGVRYHKPMSRYEF